MKNNTNPALTEAASFDAEGKHDDAINVLAAATMQGDEVAKTALGKRLLVGDRAPYLPKEAGAFILEAGQAGVADAVSVIAVFQAIGLFQQQNWEHALNTLAHAAALGSASAREQMILLADLGEPAVNPELLSNNDPKYWRLLPQEINLKNWDRIDNSEVINKDPEVKIFPGLISPAICRWLIRKSQDRLKRAMVYDSQNRRNYQSATRTNSIAEFNLVENELLHFLLQKKMSAASQIPMNQFEGTAILNYQPGQEITPHFDFVDPKIPNYDQEIFDNGQRVMTFLIYLNEGYEGGATHFTKLDLSFKGNAGDGMYFINALPDGSSDIRTEHAGMPPETGEKWIVSQFIRNREVKYILD